MLDVQNLSATYGLHHALEGATLRVDRGEIVVILGANGAGKSTLLKAVSGICEGHVSGSARLQGQELVGLQPNKIVDYGVALVPEGRGVFADLSVEENLRLGAYAPRARDGAEETLERIYTLFPKLRERRRQGVRTMSGGEQQMVAIGRAMMSNPAVLTLDEPSLGLAPKLCKELFATLKTVRDTGIGILLVEQNARASLAIADRGYLLENAHIIHQDSAEKLAKDPAVQKAYLGGGGAVAKALPPTQITPMIDRPRAPSGPSPSEIAASVMQHFTPPTKAPVPQVSTPKVVEHIEISAPATPVSPPQSAQVHGIEINALVTQANTLSKGRAEANRPAPSLPKKPNRPLMPDLDAHGDRLHSMLQEIETAASRARQRFPSSNGQTGRKQT